MLALRYGSRVHRDLLDQPIREPLRIRDVGVTASVPAGQLEQASKRAGRVRVGSVSRGNLGFEWCQAYRLASGAGWMTWFRSRANKPRTLASLLA